MRRRRWSNNSYFNRRKEIRRLSDHPNEYFKEIFKEALNRIDVSSGAKIHKHVKMISTETLSSTDLITGENAKRTAERIKTLFGQVKIIYVIRDQLTMILSIYSQYVKMGGTQNITDFVFDPILARGLFERLRYHKSIEMYFELFGYCIFVYSSP